VAYPWLSDDFCTLCALPLPRPFRQVPKRLLGCVPPVSEINCTLTSSISCTATQTCPDSNVWWFRLWKPCRRLKQTVRVLNTLEPNIGILRWVWQRTCSILATVVYSLQMPHSNWTRFYINGKYRFPSKCGIWARADGSGSNSSNVGTEGAYTPLRVVPLPRGVPVS